MKLAILTGGGKLPQMLIKHCESQNTPFHIIIFHGQEHFDVSNYEGHYDECYLGALGKVTDILKAQNVTHVVMAGAISKPSLFDLRPDFQGAKLLGSLITHHDNAILDKLCEHFTVNNMKMLGAHEVAPELLIGSGILGKITPDSQAEKDIKLGLEAALALGKLDIGQSVIVKNGVVLGLEAVEGTDALIERCASLRGDQSCSKKNKGGVLVKCTKPQQNLKADMPTIGAETMQKLADLNYSGVAVLAGSTLFLEAEKALKIADKGKIFVCGIESN